MTLFLRNRLAPFALASALVGSSALAVFAGESAPTPSVPPPTAPVLAPRAAATLNRPVVNTTTKASPGGKAGKAGKTGKSGKAGKAGRVGKAGKTGKAEAAPKHSAARRAAHPTALPTPPSRPATGASSGSTVPEKAATALTAPRGTN